MKKIKKLAYYLLIVIYVLFATNYILGVVYILGEYFLRMNLLPESVWNLLDFYYYKEAGPLRVAMSVVIFVLLSVVLAVFFRKEVSKATIILPATNLIMSIIWWTTAYWFSALTDNVEVGYVTMSVLCIVHTIATGVFLIKDTKQLDKE